MKRKTIIGLIVLGFLLIGCEQQDIREEIEQPIEEIVKEESIVVEEPKESCFFYITTFYYEACEGNVAEFPLQMKVKTTNSENKNVGCIITVQEDGRLIQKDILLYRYRKGRSVKDYKVHLGDGNRICKYSATTYLPNPTGVQDPVERDIDFDTIEDYPTNYKLKIREIDAEYGCSILCKDINITQSSYNENEVCSCLDEEGNIIQNID